MPAPDLLARILGANRWWRLLGRAPEPGPHCLTVATPEHPQTWDANFACQVTATTPEQIASVFAHLDDRFAHTPWRVVQTDPFTPPPFVAALAQAGFAVDATVIQLVLEGPVALVEPTPIATREVTSDADWVALRQLVRLNHREQDTTGAHYPPSVTDGLVAGYRAASPPMRFHLVEVAGEAVAYGAALACPDGIGIVEHLYTRPDRRRHGIISALIDRLVSDLRARGRGPILIGALADDTPRHLYHRLGFQPLLLTQGWVRRAG